jgi:hypothetical protein
MIKSHHNEIFEVKAMRIYPKNRSLPLVNDDFEGKWGSAFAKKYLYGEIL